jgi:hypothetical protein
MLDNFQDLHLCHHRRKDTANAIARMAVSGGLV